MRATEFITDLLEAAYDPMIQKMRRTLIDPVLTNPQSTSEQKQFAQQLSEILQFARNSLRRQDRVVWFLRRVQEYLKTGKPEAIGGASNLNEFQDNLWHYLGQDIPKIQSYIFLPDKSLTQVMKDLDDLENQHRTNVGRNRPPGLVGPNDRKLHEFSDGSAWWFLDRAYCAREAQAGDHCGNVAGRTLPAQRILSYRDKNGRVLLTFILNPDGKLGEMKAASNQKPSPRFHPQIITLLTSDLIKGIGKPGVAQEQDFSIFDLSPENQKNLLQRKPELVQDQAAIKPWDLFYAIPEIQQDRNIRTYLNYLPGDKGRLILELLDSSDPSRWSAAANLIPKLIMLAPLDTPDYQNRLLNYLKTSSINSQILWRRIKPELKSNSEFLGRLAATVPKYLSYFDFANLDMPTLIESLISELEVAQDNDSYPVDIDKLDTHLTTTFLNYFTDEQLKKLINLSQNQLLELRILKYRPNLYTTQGLYGAILYNKNLIELLDDPKISSKFNSESLDHLINNSLNNLVIYDRVPDRLKTEENLALARDRLLGRVKITPWIFIEHAQSSAVTPEIALQAIQSAIDRKMPREVILNIYNSMPTDYKKNPEIRQFLKQAGYIF